MSLLQRINETNDERQAGTAEQVQAQEADQAKPDAVQQHTDSRSNYSSAIANGSRQQLQDEAPTGDEQAMFTEMEQMLAEIVYGEQASNQIIKAVTTAQDPVDGVSQMAHDLTNTLSQKYPEANGDILLAIGESAIEQVVDLVEAAVPQIDLTETQMAEALSISVTRWAESHPGDMDGDMMQYMATEAPQQLDPSMQGITDGASRERPAQAPMSQLAGGGKPGAASPIQNAAGGQPNV